VGTIDRDARTTPEKTDPRTVAVAGAEFWRAAQIDWRAGYSVLVNTPAESAFGGDVALQLRRSRRHGLAGVIHRITKRCSLCVRNAGARHAPGDSEMNRPQDPQTADAGSDAGADDPAANPAADPEAPAHDDWLLDEALAETFPASDPIAPAEPRKPPHAKP
jgi:hypothetical protein